MLLIHCIEAGCLGLHMAFAASYEIPLLVIAIGNALPFSFYSTKTELLDVVPMPRQFQPLDCLDNQTSPERLRALHYSLYTSAHV